MSSTSHIKAGPRELDCVLSRSRSPQSRSRGCPSPSRARTVDRSVPAPARGRDRMRKDGRVGAPSSAAERRMDASTVVSIGIDVGKTEVAVAVHPSGATWTSDTTAAALRALARRLAALAPRVVVLEATGGYEVPVLGALAEAGVPASLVLPARVRAFAQATGRLAKTDRLDAQVLAHYGAQLTPAPTALPDGAQRALMLLVARRRQVDDMLVAERQRLDQ